MKYILILALLIRLPFFNQSLWLDESIEALALMGQYGPLLSYSLSDFQPPLYHFLLKGWTNLFGYSEIALRTPSLVAGVALVFVVMRLAKLLYSTKVSHISGLLVATNPLLIYYSQEGRTYILTTLFVTMSFYFLLKKSSLSYLFSTLLAIWSSYLACLIVPLQLLYLMRQKRYSLALALTLTAASLLFWIPSFFRSLQIGMGDAVASPEWGRVVGGISWKALALTWVKTVIGRISLSPPWLYATIVLALAFLHAHVIRHARKIRPLILYWLLGSIGLSALISLFVPAYSYTRILFVVPAYLLLLAIGLQRMSQKYTIIIVLFQLTFLTYFWFSPSFHREDWRSLARDLQADQHSTIAFPSHEQNPGLLYYGIDEARIFEPAHEEVRGERIYYIRYAEDLFDRARLGPAKLEQAGYTITSQKVYTGIGVDVYENSH